jgi:hypothetical protein
MAESLLHVAALADGHGFAHPKQGDATATQGRMKEKSSALPIRQP